MTECPSPDCQKKLNGHHTTLYGTSGMGGLVHCVSKKVSRSFLMWCAVVAISVLGTIAGLTYRAYSEGMETRQGAMDQKITGIQKGNDLRYTTRHEYYDLRGEVNALQADINHIKKAVDELKEQNDKIIRALRRLPGHD